MEPNNCYCQAHLHAAANGTPQEIFCSDLKPDDSLQKMINEMQLNAESDLILQRTNTLIQNINQFSK